MRKALTCPICKRKLSTEPDAQALRPFCSQRCRSIDLGSWLDGAYRISRPLEEEDLDEGPAPHGGPLPEPDRSDSDEPVRALRGGPRHRSH